MRHTLAFARAAWLVASAVSAIVVPAAADAQQVDRLPAAPRARVWVARQDDPRLRGEEAVAIADVTRDSVDVRLPDGGTVRVARARLQRVAVSGGTRTPAQGARHGAGWGAFLGGIVGGVIAGVAGSNSQGNCIDCGVVYLAAGLGGGAVVGAITGAVVGHEHPGERWRVVHENRRAR